jgi:hypothetical protein
VVAFADPTAFVLFTRQNEFISHLFEVNSTHALKIRPNCDGCWIRVMENRMQWCNKKEEKMIANGSGSGQLGDGNLHYA